MIVYTLGALADIYACKSRVSADFVEQMKSIPIQDGNESSDYARGRSDAWKEAETLLREYLARGQQ